MDDVSLKVLNLERRVLELERFYAQLLSTAVKVSKEFPSVSSNGFLRNPANGSTYWSNSDPYDYNLQSWMKNNDNGRLEHISKEKYPVTRKEKTVTNNCAKENIREQTLPSGPITMHEHTSSFEKSGLDYVRGKTSEKCYQHSSCIPRIGIMEQSMNTENNERISTCSRQQGNKSDNSPEKGSIQASVISNFHPILSQEDKRLNNFPLGSGVMSYQENAHPDREISSTLLGRHESTNLCNGTTILTTSQTSCIIPNPMLNPESIKISSNLTEKTESRDLDKGDACIDGMSSGETSRKRDNSKTFQQLDKVIVNAPRLDDSPSHCKIESCTDKHCLSKEKVQTYCLINDPPLGINLQGAVRHLAMTSKDIKGASPNKGNELTFEAGIKKQINQSYNLAFLRYRYNQNTNLQYLTQHAYPINCLSNPHAFILPRKINGRQVNGLDIIDMWENGYFKMPPLKYWRPSDKTLQQSKISRWKKIYSIYKNFCKGNRDLFIKLFSKNNTLLSVSAILIKYDKMVDRKKKGSASHIVAT